MDIKFDEKGLVPVVAQDWRTGEIRMLAYANKEAIEKTVKTGYAHYFSRSRNKIWKKGETSGELQRVKEIRIDCDGDALIYMVEQGKNKACHTGERNCFFRRLNEEKVNNVLPFETLQRLEEIIRERIEKLPENSYTAKLVKEGKDRILQKFGEEAIESLIALKNGNKEEIKEEVADMLYFLVLALSVNQTSVTEIMEELSDRIKSGGK